MRNLPICKACNIARAWTCKAANVKDWRVTNKKNKALQALAQELQSGRGYIIASPREVFARYGAILPEVWRYGKLDDTPRVWGVLADCPDYRGRVSFNLASV